MGVEKKKAGNVTTMLRQAKAAVITACKYGVIKDIDKIREAIGVCKVFFYGKSITRMTSAYTHSRRTRYSTKYGDKQRQCVVEFCHSDESSSIDSNSRKVIRVGEEDHAGRVWLVKTCNEQYDLFLFSETVKTYKARFGRRFKVTSRTFFLQNRCRCVSAPVMQSCVDIIKSSLYHNMKALSKFIRTNKQIREQLQGCELKAYLNKRVEDLVEATCCTKVPHPSLIMGAGTSMRVPKLIPFACIEKGGCANCGVEKKLKISECKVLTECDSKIELLEWVHAPRPGKKKNGKQNTQLELGRTICTVSNVLEKLVINTENCRIHICEGTWCYTSHRRDLTMSDPDKHRVISTDFGATLDLRAAETDNCSVDNHAVVDIFFITYDWRPVKYNRKDGSVDETIISTTDKWIFFADTLSRGKKNDHVCHNACLKKIIEYYDKKRMDIGKQPIPINIVWTDNCGTQYKCRQNFYHVANSSIGLTSKGIIVHKFAQKYWFKGPWDAYSKVVKMKIYNFEVQGVRCATAYDCYNNLRYDLTKTGYHMKMAKLLDYERNGDERVLENTLFTTHSTFIGYATADKQEYDCICSQGNNHIVFIDRENIPDMKAITGTQKFSQVQAYSDTNKKLISSNRPCSCINCLMHIEKFQDCFYNRQRSI